MGNGLTIGEKWETVDGDEVTIVSVMPHKFVKCLNEKKKLEVIHESRLRFKQ